MTGQVLKLEDFALSHSHGQTDIAPSLSKETEKENFDKGYHAGWEDAIKEARTIDDKARADAAAALQQIDFTYFEARQHVMSSFRPLLEAVMNAVLPTAAKHALVPLVKEELETLAASIEAPVELFCAPETASVVSEQVGNHSKSPISVVSEETLTASQVQIRFAGGMTSVDTDAAVERIQSAIQKFFESTEIEAKKHGLYGKQLFK